MPALILMDKELYQRKRLRVLGYLKTNPTTQPVPVVMLSSSAHGRFILYAYDVGVNAFKVKPQSDSGYDLIAETLASVF